MGLTVGEKVGAVLGFIPGVSTVTGIVKFTYYRVKVARDCKKIRKTNKEAEKAQAVALNTFGQTAKSSVNVNNWRTISNIERDLAWKSLGEILPGLNIIAAFSSINSLRALSKERDVNNDQTSQQAGIIRKYDLRSPKPDQYGNIPSDDFIKINGQEVSRKKTIEKNQEKIANALFKMEKIDNTILRYNNSVEKIFKSRVQVKGGDDELYDLDIFFLKTIVEGSTESEKPADTMARFLIEILPATNKHLNEVKSKIQTEKEEQLAKHGKHFGVGRELGTTEGVLQERLNVFNLVAKELLDSSNSSELDKLSQENTEKIKGILQSVSGNTTEMDKRYHL